MQPLNKALKPFDGLQRYLAESKALEEAARGIIKTSETFDKLRDATNEESIADFVRRLVYCTLIGNADRHLKNWSLIYYDRRTASLSPAYDLLSTIPTFRMKRPR